MAGFFLIFKRAILFGVALLFSPQIQAANKAPGAKAQILNAQELFVKSDRRQALALLNAAIAAPNLGPKEREELIAAANEIAGRFLTDKGQRLYELGHSLLPTQVTQALSSFRKAQALESGNFLVELAVIQAEIRKDECASARKALEPLLPEFAYAREIHEFNLIAGWCLEDAAAIGMMTEKTGPEQKLTPATVKVAQAWLVWQQKDVVKAQALLRDARALEPDNLVGMYWTWRIKKENEEESLAEATALVSRCGRRESRANRKVMALEEICLHLPEVEAYLKARAAENGDDEK